MLNHLNSSEFTWHRTNKPGFFADVPRKYTFVSLSAKDNLTGFYYPEGGAKPLHLYNPYSLLVLYYSEQVQFKSNFAPPEMGGGGGR